MSKIEKFEDIKAWQKARELVKYIAGDFDSQSDDEFIRFLGYGLRSATEVQSHLYVSLDQDYIKEDSFKKLFKEIGQIKSLIAGFIHYLRSES